MRSVSLVNTEDWEYSTGGPDETQELAGRLAAILRPGDVLLLVGELGAGKTCFVQGLARGLGVADQVTSPTFTLLREYSGRLPLYHLDAYRLEGPGDLFDIGVEEYLESGGVLVVEWGDRARDFFSLEHLEVAFDFAGGDDERRIRFMAHGGSWEGRIPELKGLVDGDARR
jgi:tRNA threonylcarbamoyladenosine biosynthesis protein TsaE